MPAARRNSVRATPDRSTALTSSITTRLDTVTSCATAGGREGVAITTMCTSNRFRAHARADDAQKLACVCSQGRLAWLDMNGGLAWTVIAASCVLALGCSDSD